MLAEVHELVADASLLPEGEVAQRVQVVVQLDPLEIEQVGLERLVLRGVRLLEALLVRVRVIIVPTARLVIVLDLPALRQIIVCLLYTSPSPRD